MGAFESGQAFLAGVFAKLPEAVRAQVKAEFDKPEAKDAIILIGDGALARSDYSKQMDDLKKKEDELDDLKGQHETWYTENHAALQDYVKIKPEYDTLKKGNPNPNPNPNPKPGIDEDKVVTLVDGRLEMTSRSFAGAMALAFDLVQEHNRMFGEKLDIRELLADPRLGKQIAGQPDGRVVGLQDIYNAKFGEKVAAKHRETEEKKFNDEVNRRLEEERKKNPSPQPFPLRDSSPSPLDALLVKDGPAQHTVDTAVAEYDRLSQVRNAAQ